MAIPRCKPRKLGSGCMDEKDELSGIESYLKELFPGCVIENTRAEVGPN